MFELKPRRNIAFVVTLFCATSTYALAQTNNVVLENVSVAVKDKGATVFKRIEVTNTNLTKDELAKLFSGAASKDDAAALIKKMKADKISIPEAVFTDKDSTFTFRDFLATGVNEGKVANAVLKSVDGTGKSKGGSVTFKAGALELQGLGFGSAISAMTGGDLTDGSAQIGKMSFAGFQMTMPDDDTKADAPGGNLIKISLASLTAESTYDGEIPLKGKGEAKGLVIEPPKNSEFGKSLASFGYDKITVGFVASGNYDKTKKTYDLDNFTISGVNAGAVGMKILLGGIEPSVFSANKEAKLMGLMGGDVSSFSLRFDNAGLFEKGVDFTAKQQKKSPDALKKEWSAMATQFLPLILGGDPASLKLAEAAAKFIATPKNITISIKSKGAPLKFVELMQIRDPNALLKLVNIDAVAGQ